MPPEPIGIEVVAAPHTIGGVATTEVKARELRADAQRNRQRIIAAAIELFAEQGLDASTAEIAQHAGVGEATLFRRFPSKDDLVLAIVSSQMALVVELASSCLLDPDPGEGLRRFIAEMVERFVDDRGVMEGAKARCMTSSELDGQRRELMSLMTALVKRAQEAGAVRKDLTGQDLGLLIGAVASTADLPYAGMRDDLWKRYLGIVMDGLRPAGATKLRPAAPSRRLFEHPEP